MAHIRTQMLQVLLLGLATSGYLNADDHVVVEQRRTYMGNTLPARVTEVWISDNMTYMKTGRAVFIYRFDLGKMFAVAPDRNRYFESTIKSPGGEEKQPPRPINPHKLGFDYVPQFDWSVGQSLGKDSVDGHLCDRVIVNGDADYSQKSVELWLTKDVPIRLDRYFERYLDYTLDPDWRGIYAAFREVREYLIVRSRETYEMPIAPTMINEIRVVKVEVATPPDGIYEIPQGSAMVNSYNELFQ